MNDPAGSDPHCDTAERERREAALDETIEQSFPASDPPSSDPNPDAPDAITPWMPGGRLSEQKGRRDQDGGLTLKATNQDDSDIHKGAIEDDRPDDEGEGDAAMPALNSDGLPAN